MHSDGLRASGFDPLSLRLRGGHPRDLADSGPGEYAGAQGLARLRKLFQCFRNPESLAAEARAVAEQPLDVLGETAVAKMHVGAASKGGQ